MTINDELNTALLRDDLQAIKKLVTEGASVVNAIDGTLKKTRSDEAKKLLLFVHKADKMNIQRNRLADLILNDAIINAVVSSMAKSYADITKLQQQTSKATRRI